MTGISYHITGYLVLILDRLTCIITCITTVLADVLRCPHVCSEILHFLLHTRQMCCFERCDICDTVVALSGVSHVILPLYVDVKSH